MKRPPKFKIKARLRTYITYPSYLHLRNDTDANRVAGFQELKLSNSLGNIKSRKLKEKQGAKLIGARKANFVNPVYDEAEDWILTKEAWSQSRIIK